MGSDATYGVPRADHGLLVRPGDYWPGSARYIGQRHIHPSLGVLILILTVQACLSLHLVWANTAFGDEALYLWAGHLEIAHWLHGTAIPAFPAYFSGAPIIYPPLGAIADSIGGLAAARILSLVFMLGATSLLWFTATYMFGRRAALFTAAIWATLASTQFLGAFATYDALALFLTALAAWCAVHAGKSRRSAGWLVGAALALAAANAAKYASGIFDPVVAGLVFATGLQKFSWRQAAARSMTLLGYTAGALVFLIALGGGEYVTGVSETTLVRASGTSTVSQVLSEAWHLTAVVVLIAMIGSLISFITEPLWPRRILLMLLTSAALLVPIEQARVHTTFSLQKHVDFGAWFASIAAGYAVDALTRLIRARSAQWLLVALCTFALVFPVRVATHQARKLFSNWPNSTSLTITLRGLLARTSGPILVSTPDVAEYYLPREGAQWYRWSNLYTIRLADGKALTSGVIGQTAGRALYEDKIRHGFFQVVVINLEGSDVGFNQALLPVVMNSHRYVLQAVTGYWKSEIFIRTQPQVLSYHIRRPASSPLGGLLTPVAKPSPVLGAVIVAVELSGAAALVFTVTVRVAWRRNKASDEI